MSGWVGGSVGRCREWVGGWVGGWVVLPEPVLLCGKGGGGRAKGRREEERVHVCVCGWGGWVGEESKQARRRSPLPSQPTSSTYRVGRVHPAAAVLRGLLVVVVVIRHFSLVLSLLLELACVRSCVCVGGWVGGMSMGRGSKAKLNGRVLSLTPLRRTRAQGSQALGRTWGGGCCARWSHVSVGWW